MSPTPEDFPGVCKRVEHFFIQTFIAELPVEVLDEPVLLGFARRDIVPGDAGLVLPFEDSAARQLRAVVRDDGFGLAIEPDEAAQLTRVPAARLRPRRRFTESPSS